MPKSVFNFNSKEVLDEAIAYLLPRMPGGLKTTTVDDVKLCVEARDSGHMDEFREELNNFNELRRLDKLTAKVISTLTSIVKENKNHTLRLMNGDLVRLSPDNARKIVSIHDQLDHRENQAALRMMVIESKKSHEAAIQFCLEKTKETE
jgi:hypothetical protein